MELDFGAAGAVVVVVVVVGPPQAAARRISRRMGQYVPAPDLRRD
jgi:hypothetical protein